MQKETEMTHSKSFSLFVFVSIVIIRLFLLTIVALASCSSVEVQSHNLMPVPAKIAFGKGELKVDSEFEVALRGYQEPRLERAVL